MAQARKAPAKKASKKPKKASTKALQPKKKTVVEGELVEGPGGPRITKGGKSGVYQTPLDFFSAVLNRFGGITFDLAALKENTKAKDFFSPEQDALKQAWHEIQGRCWLNPPFTFLRPWIEKCLQEAHKGADIVCLVPAAVGSRWFRRFALHQADVIFLEGRIEFDGKAPYPKDCMIVHFHKGMAGKVETWDWRDDMDPQYMTDRRRKKLEKEAAEDAASTTEEA